MLRALLIGVLGYLLGRAATHPDPPIPEPVRGENEPDPATAAFLYLELEKPIKKQFQSFQRLEEQCLTLLGVGSVVIGLGGFSDFADAPTASPILLAVALGFYAVLAVMTLAQIFDRKRRYFGSKQLWDAHRLDTVDGARLKMIEGTTRAFETNQTRLKRKNRYLQVASCALFFETALVGVALTVAGFS